MVDVMQIVSVSVLFVLCIFRFMKRRKNEVIVFTRYPVAGKAKTRLIPALGSAGAARLQVCMTEHVLQTLQKVYNSLNKAVNVTLQYNGGTQAQMHDWLDRKLWGLPCVYRPQTGNSLGEKLKFAVKDSFSRGNERVVVIGADIPGITETVVVKAFEALSKPRTDMVIGKAEDGGYYLIGFNKNAKRYIDDVFEDIEWGTDKVFLQQINKAETLQASVSILPVILQDVDTEEDIAVFEREVGISRDELCDTTWSIIVPTLNEEKNITKMLNNVIQSCSNLKNVREIIICDGGSCDKSEDVVKEFSKTSPVIVRMIQSKPGRGNQLITGVTAASGTNYLFLHADTKLPKNFDVLAIECLETPGVVAGAFPFQLDVLEDSDLKRSEPWWFILQMKGLVWGANLRASKYEKPYGDQALFMKKRTYKTAGGFPPYFLMEDYILIEKLKTLGHIGIVKGSPIVTSYRRWRKWGYFKVTGLSQLIIIAYKLGVHPNTLAKWYYGDKIKMD
ncbi:uncharacterized protein LOC123529317 [Mercenaria mercenaria]|uniref:uncharacterized protein LOC123529317 n=1 Tax=Mercenaria mercenaria TaxID=6596 RepID=UPI00234E89EF|nr:uncharacterized protein LOC123529317 [Mercenaria mercenaria]XP_053377642.1 uncharacterized protein LOC123529317 [Mercenaria mercenaria]